MEKVKLISKEEYVKYKSLCNKYERVQAKKRLGSKVRVKKHIKL
jgi:hypothetical protein